MSKMFCWKAPEVQNVLRKSASNSRTFNILVHLYTFEWSSEKPKKYKRLNAQRKITFGIFGMFANVHIDSTNAATQHL